MSAETDASLHLDGETLRSVRRRTALTQKQLARHLDVPRELVSMWETEARVPDVQQVKRLADVLSVPVKVLAGKESVSEWDRSTLRAELPSAEQVQTGVERWLNFLDRWAYFLDELGSEGARPDKPPRPLDRGSCITDARRAPTLADEVRDHYGLGRNALPNLWTFLDEHGVLTCRAALGPLHTDPGIAGAFYNHDRLGFCILVNASSSPGRQTFAKAHAYAHALFHYVRRGVVCKRGSDSRVERFANAFADHFLVPRKKLREMVKNVAATHGLDAYKALHLATHFRVSYPTILRRLLAERHITREEHAEMRTYSPGALARRIGLHPWHFRIEPTEDLRLNRYPLSVLERARRAVETGSVPPSEIAALLQVDEEVVQANLLTDPPEATAEELREYDELPK